MKKISTLMVIVLVIGTGLAACAQSPSNPAAVSTPVSVATAASSGGGVAWQQKWENVQAQAKKEGTLNIYVAAAWGSELRLALTKKLQEKYGIDLAFTPFVGGSDLVVKVKEEQRAGLYVVDVFGVGTTTLLLSMKPADLLGPVESMLILPEVLDPQAWQGGELFTFDKDHTMVNMLRVINRSIVYNKDMIKEDEINSYKDFLKPVFKGKLTMTDPTQSGPGGWFANHLVDVYGFDEGLAFLRDLMVKQEMVIQRDSRIHMESVARGKYGVALGGGTQYIADFLALGAPIAVKIPKEGDGGGTSLGGLAVPKTSPHPNATVLFVNWLLTKEGQSLLAKYSGNPSRRLDAATEGVNPIFMPLPGEKVAWDTAEFTLRNSKVMEAARDILARAPK